MDASGSGSVFPPQGTARIEGLLEAAPDAMLVVTAGGTIQCANALAERLFGHAPGTLAGNPLDLLLPAGSRRLHLHHVADHLEGRRSRMIANGLQTLAGLRADGTEFPAEIGLNPIRIGDTPLVVMAIRDASPGRSRLTELERRVEARTMALSRANRRLERHLARLDTARVELERSRSHLQAVLDSLSEGVVIADLDGRILEMNPSALRLHGLTREEARRNLAEYPDLVDLEDLAGNRLTLSDWPLSRVMRGESFTDLELVMHRKPQGISRIISYSGTQVRGRGGTPILYVLTSRDVTERHRTEAARREAEQRVELAVHIAELGFWEMDLETRKFYVSPLSKKILGYQDAELPDRREDWIARLHPDDRERVLRYLDDIVREPHADYLQEYRVRHRDGSYRWIASRAMLVTDAAGRATKLIGTHLDITARKLGEQRIREAALHDALTGLPTRALVFEYGSHLLAAGQRSHGHGALLFVDLDRFKQINDLYGHEAGDQVLQEVARRLLHCTRQEDLVGRLGGDEFVVLLPYLDAGRHRAAAVAQHIIDRVSQPIAVASLQLSLSPSIGISYFPEHGADVDALIHAADIAMYQAKQLGRANFQFYTPELNRRAGEVFRLESRLKGALRNGGLRLYYQPVVDIGTGRLTGAEALVRLDDGASEAIGPGSFIPVAESAGLIGELGEWVATEACRQHEDWLRQGLNVTIAINVSPLQFRLPAFADTLDCILSATGMDPGCLQLEVAESTVMESVDEAVTILARVKSLGLKVALDDFGTGCSSLASLSRLPVDKLKVDRSFVQRLELDRISQTITDAIIALGHSLKLDVVGEGIESEPVLRYLAEHGCNQAQGFWFSQPLPAPEFARWCRRRAAA